MTNQVFSWSIFIAPWLTLFFMKREEIKRYMPVALLAIVITTIIHDTGIGLGFWVVRETAFPLYEMLPYFYGLIPVLTLWIFKFTNGRFWIYVITNIILDIGFAFYLLGNMFPNRGIYALVGITSTQVLLLNLGHFTLLYVFQKWQEGELVTVAKNLFTPKLYSAATKPFFNNNSDKAEN
ncbi:MAG: hypothetical protein CVU90_11020 [Firmicutes bacterium HGW-Firmicutes-15]|nr:MAG: hypothetical protein CVU90_11020 [Firmicutes bacterium HGW-Firmicutes-15]